MMLRIIIKLIEAMGKIICHRTVKFRQRGEEGNGFKAVVYRDNVFTEAQWNTFGTIDHVESWNNTSGSRNGCRNGDLFQVIGAATDTLNSHVLTYRCNNSSGNLAGICIAHQMTPAGEKGFGITLTLTRNNLYTEANWNSYAAIGHTETYNKRDGDSDLTICRVGDYFVVSGTSSDKGLNHTATYKCTSVNANQIAGSCVSHTKDGVQGNTGKAGRWYEYAGEYGVDLPASLTNTDNHGWWVKRGNNCFQLIAASGTTAQTSTIPTTASGNSTWELMEGDTRKFFIGAAFFGAYAHLGAFIVNNDWAISQYGVFYDEDGYETVVDSTNYQTLVGGHLPYTYFDEDHPNSNVEGSMNFCPTFALDGKTGQGFMKNIFVRGEFEGLNGCMKMYSESRDIFSRIGVYVTTVVENYMKMLSTDKQKELLTLHTIMNGDSEGYGRLLLKNYSEENRAELKPEYLELVGSWEGHYGRVTIKHDDIEISHNGDLYYGVTQDVVVGGKTLKFIHGILVDVI